MVIDQKYLTGGIWSSPINASYWPGLANSILLKTCSMLKLEPRAGAGSLTQELSGRA
jgi:hypothetical protein